MEEPEIKHEFDVNSHLQCPTCLSLNRKLAPIGKYIDIYRKLIFTIENYNLLPPELLQVCWECRAVLRKAAIFQLRVKKVCDMFKLGQIYPTGILSNLTAVVASDTHPNTIYIVHQDNTISEITKSEIQPQDVKGNFDNDSFIDEADELSMLGLPPDFDIEAVVKAEIKYDLHSKKKGAQSKTVNRWAQKRALQNKKPKFRVLTNKDIKKFIRVEKIDTVELQNYLQSKKISESYQNMSYKCGSCVIGFKDRNSYLKHHRKYHKMNIGEYLCDVCASTFKNKRHLSAHISKHYNKFTCLVCEYHSYCIEDKTEHVKQHKKVFQCLKCELMFSNRREFYKHFKQWHEKFICDHCGVSFKMRYCIKDHIRKQHSPFECIPCNKRFARYNGLWLHNKTHHTTPSSGNEGYCVECDKHYPDVYRYRWHLANSARHKPRKKTRIPCPGCEKVFSKNIYMKDHFNLVHLKCYKYRCEDCNKNFIRNADLVKHRRRVHEGLLPPRNKICYMCGRGFTTNKILANHIRTHTGERPFACALCPARFAQSAALAGHVRALHRHIQAE